MKMQTSPVEMDQEQARRIRLARIIILVSMLAASVILIVFLNLLFAASQFSAPYMIGVAFAFIVLCAISLWFIRRRQLNWAITIYLLGLINGLIIAINLLGGVTGPVTVGLVMAVVIAGLLGGTKRLRDAS
ncbi:MAG: hypothetical protein JXR84_20470, partial [Anaerolineae bacterium]|nr:hypothetical protein [Anaerolineae bacterium]